MRVLRLIAVVLMLLGLLVTTTGIGHAHAHADATATSDACAICVHAHSVALAPEIAPTLAPVVVALPTVVRLRALPGVEPVRRCGGRAPPRSLSPSF